ncbi:MAG: molybdopterin cofactor-binding domain-containing protein [Sporichthyaceae bacterium]
MTPKSESHNEPALVTDASGSPFQGVAHAYHESDGSPTLVDPSPRSVPRRTFVGFVVAGSSLIVAGRYVLDSDTAAAAAPNPGVGGPAGGRVERALSRKVPVAEGATPILSNDLPGDHYDFMDFMRDATRPVTPLLTLELKSNGRVYFEVPRAEVGQSIESGCAQIIADQLEMSYDKVDIVQSKARIDLLDAHLTGGSSSTFSLWEPLRELSELIRMRVIGAAATQWGVSADRLRTKEGVVYGPGGRKASYGDLSVIAASPQNEFVGALLNAAIGPPKRGVIGKSVPRKDLREIVTGKKIFAMDLDIPNALPCMLRRPPQINGVAESINNKDKILKMPGVTDVAIIPAALRGSVVAVRAKTFGQCVDAVRALDVTWGVGTTGKITSDEMLKQVDASLIPMEPGHPGAEVFEEKYTFQFRVSGPLETNSAVADVRADSAELWGSSKIPGTVLAQVSELLNMSPEKIVCNVVYGGGSFGTTLHGDRFVEAAAASKAFGKPVRLMWHRTDQVRFGREKPGAVSHVQATKVGNSITSFTQWHASEACDFTHSAGDLITAQMMKKDPSRYYGNTSVTDWFYQIVTAVPYNFGPTKTALTEAYEYDFIPTGPVRNVYSPDVACARELLVEDLAKAFGMDGYQFRRAFAKNAEVVAVLDAVAKRGQWGRKLPKGVHQAIAVHGEYKAQTACLMEIDNRPKIVKERKLEGRVGPRITKAIFAASMGVLMNPDVVKGLVMGGMIDGIAHAFSEACDWQDGLPIQGGWDDYGWTRHWDAPLEFEAILIEHSSTVPSGVGELGVGAGFAAAAIAAQNALGKKVTGLPVFYRDPDLIQPFIDKKEGLPQSPTKALPA